jgi:1,4-alpha-glucan branching enzyme
MRALGSTGVWEIFLPKLSDGEIYKFEVRSTLGNLPFLKADPYAFRAELRPRTGSIVATLDGYNWNDGYWMAERGRRDWLSEPIATYEVHLGSWRHPYRQEGRDPDGGRWLSYDELGDQLIPYVKAMGFTHIELMPVMEHPFDGSWGYETIGYFAPTSRFGTPADFMYLVDHLHQRGIGVILDWVPAHFPKDEAGLAYFDGSHLYEHADPKQGEHPDWGTYVFNYGRNEVRNFLISNALFWFDKYHVDGLRADAVASMLYLDYGRKEGQWIPNRYGGKENIEAIDFLRALNEAVHSSFPGVTMIAEESTAWPQVSRPTYVGGLGFDLKWNMGWMHDVLDYMEHDPIFRSYRHNEITFGLQYAFTENFVLPFSHDEVVYGKGSMLNKMPGDDWQKFANLRLLYGFMFGHPGKKLLFMGDEFGQRSEWNHEASLDWHLLDNRMHAGLRRWVRDLNTLYRGAPALHELDCSDRGFEWIDCTDSQRSVLTFLRRGNSNNGGSNNDLLLFACNFTPVVRTNYRVGVPFDTVWKEILNSDADLYGGSSQGNLGALPASPLPIHGRPFSLAMTLPPLSVVVFQPQPSGGTP